MTFPKRFVLPVCWRKFASILSFYSSKSYNYVRQRTLPFLPHPKSVSRWFCQIPLECGVSKLAIVAIKNKVQETENGNVILCNLVIDEISIKRKIESLNGQDYGYSDFKKTEEAESAIICLLVALNGRWKFQFVII